MTALLLVAPLAAATVWWWATSPTYRAQRAAWRQHRRDRTFARRHRVR